MFEEMMKMVQPLVKTNDASFEFYGGRYHLTINDFEGFDDDWNEIMRDYDEEKVDILLEWLKNHASSVNMDYYELYHFNGFDVEIGFTSYDI